MCAPQLSAADIAQGRDIATLPPYGDLGSERYSQDYLAAVERKTP
jgi:hypothetical protein